MEEATEFTLSLPVLGAWIEMVEVSPAPEKVTESLPVLGAWIEIADSDFGDMDWDGRSLYWERGLKYSRKGWHREVYAVAPCIGSVD